MESEGLDFWNKLKYMFSDPDLLIEKIGLENGIRNSLLMYVIILTFFTAITSMFTIGLLLLMGITDDVSFFHQIFMIIIIVTFLISLASTFIYSGLVHLLVIAFKGKRSYKTTYNVYTYSMIPYLIIGMAPLGFLAIIYSIILMILGVSKLHDISKLKAGIACLLPGFLFFFIYVTFLVLLLMYT